MQIFEPAEEDFEVVESFKENFETGKRSGGLKALGEKVSCSSCDREAGPCGLNDSGELRLLGTGFFELNEASSAGTDSSADDASDSAASSDLGSAENDCVTRKTGGSHSAFTISPLRTVLPCVLVLLAALIGFLLPEFPPDQFPGFLASFVKKAGCLHTGDLQKSPEYASMLTSFARAQQAAQASADQLGSSVSVSRQAGRELRDQLSLLQLGALSTGGISKARVAVAKIRELARQYSAYSDSAFESLLKERTVFAFFSDRMPALMTALAEGQRAEAMAITDTFRKQLQRLEDTVEVLRSQHRGLEESTQAAEDEVLELGAVMRGEGLRGQERVLEGLQMRVQAWSFWWGLNHEKMALANEFVQQGTEQKHEAAAADGMVQEFAGGVDHVIKELSHRSRLYSRIKDSLNNVIEAADDSSVFFREGGNRAQGWWGGSSRARINAELAKAQWNDILRSFSCFAEDYTRFIENGAAAATGAVVERATSSSL